MAENEVSIEECNTLFSKLKSLKGSTAILTTMKKLDDLHVRFSESLSEDQTLIKFFKIWERSRDSFFKKAVEEDQLKSAVQDFDAEAIREEEAIDQPQKTSQLRASFLEKDLYDSLLEERRELNSNLRNLTKTQSSLNGQLQAHSEALSRVEENVGQAISSLKASNRELSKATLADADSAKIKLVMGGTGVGLAGGSLAAPGVGTVVGGVVGNRLGAWIGGWVKGRTEANVKKLEEAT